MHQAILAPKIREEKFEALAVMRSQAMGWIGLGCLLIEEGKVYPLPSSPTLRIRLTDAVEALGG
jgi:hypothetical protein